MTEKITDERLAEMLAELEGVTRVESGPIRFGDDWSGVFFRGDDAMHKAFSIGSVIPEVTDTLTKMVLAGTVKSLSACREPSDAFVMPSPNDMRSILTELQERRRTDNSGCSQVVVKGLEFTHVAKTKLDDLLARGWEINGYSIRKGDEMGLLTKWGFAGWYSVAVQNAEAAEQRVQKLEQDRLVALAAMNRIAPYLDWTIGDGSPGHHPTMPSAVAAFQASHSALKEQP